MGSVLPETQDRLQTCPALERGLHAGAAPIEGAADLTLKDWMRVSRKTAAESIDASPPANVWLHGSTMANNPKHPDVTFLAGGSRFEVAAAGGGGSCQ